MLWSVAEGPVEDKSLAVHTRAQCWGPVLCNLFVNDWDGPALQMRQNWEEQQIHLKVVWPSRGTLTDWRNGQVRISCTSIKINCKVMQLERVNPKHQYRLGADQLDQPGGSDGPGGSDV